MVWEIILYENEKGKSPIGDFLTDLSDKAKAKCLSYMQQLEQRGKTLQAFSQYAKKLSDYGEYQIWELRPEYGGTEYRLVYCEVKPNIAIILHAFVKKRQKTDVKDINIAKDRLKAYLETNLETSSETKLEDNQNEV